ncbi:MAG: DNA phosphorothioation system sulfurtransferase DndC [Kofleriaceae bacterium]|nr:DNA phosphorothioation system sulfurtransferase DndC [Kofleriaceae bacterium]MBP9166385.1 DNA phosphorothioation system sulfurtransferase DndC [Kofleriaceae bacterium]MBP9858626.1 DNA phosphorothioation system sulfurtransferase DndC [Kofleriaceae bacterium]
MGYSGGKDSTLVLQLVFEVLLDLDPSARRRPVHVLTNDTLVESPILASYIEAMIEKLRVAANDLALPMTVVKTTPDPEQTFWVNLIGRGYPSPNRMFRWCTDRMKIRPTSDYITSTVAANGQAILLLGVRRAESAVRAASVDRYAPKDGSRLNPHNDLKGCLVFRPIVDLETDEVWQLLLQRPPPWGGSHRDLVTLYRNAQGGECPLVLDNDEAPSCGSNSSRFGCWTCTVVEKDKSMEGFIDNGFDHLEPLLYFRDWLAAIRNDRARRQRTRRNGLVTLMKDGTPVPGPFTLEARREILERLLAVQREVGLELITAKEQSTIRRLWSHDAAEEARRTLAAIRGAHKDSTP